MKSFFVGIAGGSGVGKSSISFALLDNYPDKIGIIHLDDYFVKKEMAPTYKGFTNWDHPDSIRFDDFIHDLQMLKSGKAIIVRTKSEKFNPDYGEIGKISIEIAPKPIMFIDGWMVLWHPAVCTLLDLSIYLDAPHGLRMQRRIRAKNRDKDEKQTNNEDYTREILLPMHYEYVEPTKQYADHIFDTSNIPLESIIARVEKLLPVD